MFSDQTFVEELSAKQRSVRHGPQHTDVQVPNLKHTAQLPLPHLLPAPGMQQFAKLWGEKHDTSTKHCVAAVSAAWLGMHHLFCQALLEETEAMQGCTAARKAFQSLNPTPALPQLWE